MRDKKHIDRLFQEHFKDFEVAPPETVWNKIEDKLNHALTVDKQKKVTICVHPFIAAYLRNGFAVELGRHQKEDIVHYHLMYPSYQTNKLRNALY